MQSSNLLNKLQKIYFHQNNRFCVLFIGIQVRPFLVSLTAYVKLAAYQPIFTIETPVFLLNLIHA